MIRCYAAQQEKESVQRRDSPRSEKRNGKASHGGVRQKSSFRWSCQEATSVLITCDERVLIQIDEVHISGRIEGVIRRTSKS